MSLWLAACSRRDSVTTAALDGYEGKATPAIPEPNVVEWLRRNEREIAGDPIILGEVRFGILLLPKGKRRTRTGVRIIDPLTR